MEHRSEPQPPPGWLPPTTPVGAPDPGLPAAGGSPFGEERRPWWKRVGGLIGLIVLGAVKLGAKLKAILLLLPKLKLLTTSGSMLVSVAAYSLIWGWRFAAGF
ncbi:MAG: peptidase, partial [Solirubrobacterales bacterium]|nr:peptidase [Solirubrobacterales bacterium]